MSIVEEIKRFRKPIHIGAFAGLLLTGLIIVFTASAYGIGFSSAMDRDTNAIINGGAPSTTSLISSYTSDAYVQAVYDYFRITKADVAAMNTTAVAGKVTKNGEVLVGNRVVATNAQTAGRQNMGSSRRVTHNNATFYVRSPGVSLRSNSLDAYVVMKNGQFAYAVIASCGNPVSAQPKPQPQPQPQPKPSYLISKEVQANGENTWHESVIVDSGTTVRFRIKLTNTGKVAIKDMRVSDVLPNRITYVPGTMTYGGQTVPEPSALDLFNGGAELGGEIGSGMEDAIMFDAVAGRPDAEVCTAEMLVNTAGITAPGLPTLKDTASVGIRCKAQVKPNYECTSLKAIPGAIDSATGNQSYTFTATANASNATINSYTFRFDNPQNNNETVLTNATTATSDSVTYVPGTYHPSVTVSITPDGGSPVEVSDTRCAATITVGQPNKPVTPAAPPPTTTPPPTTPTMLVTTGSGAAIGAFVSTVVGGAIAYRMVWLRRYPS